MDEFIQQELNDITTAAESIICRIRGIYGYCNGMETAASRYESPPNSIPIAQFNHGNGFGNQKSLLEVIKEMIIELKIKGSVRERANGLIELRTQAFGSIYGRTKEEIETKLTTALKEAKKQKKSKKQKEQFSVPTNFDQFAVYWFENFHKRKVKENTYRESIRLYTRHIKSKFEKYTLRDINPIMLQAFLDEYSDRGKTAYDLHSQINQILNSAVKHGLINLNPLGMVFHTQHKRKHGESISKSDEKLLLNAFENTPFQMQFAIILYTGLRPNEYSSVTISENFIKAINSKRRKKDGTVIYKYIPISPMLRPYLANINDLKMASPIMLMKRLKKILPNYCLYDMRTTFQTRCTECGISDVAIGLFMGNSIGGALKQAYTDISDEYLLKEGEKLNY